VTWEDGKASGTCEAQPCRLANTNDRPGGDCACKDGFKGELSWNGAVLSGECNPAPCNVENSNGEDGPYCACKGGYQGKILWDGDKASGDCTKKDPPPAPKEQASAPPAPCPPSDI
jgi:hypothetical protein